jgi:hypothetical protein
MSGVAELEWMVGRWRIEGEVGGAAVTGEAEVRFGVEGCVLEARERVLGPDGALDYEDLAVYHWDAGALALRVHHFAAPGEVTRYTALPLDGRRGVHWMRDDLAARVVIWPDEQGFCSEVWFGVSEAPESRLRYRPAEAASSASMSTNQPAS